MARAVRITSAMLGLMVPGIGYAQESLSDPSGSNTLMAAVGWLKGTMLGTVATTVAVVAVAYVGFMMLAGRVDWRRGVTVVVGCFVLFGAREIAGGIQSAAGSPAEFAPIPQAAYGPSPLPPPSPPPPRVQRPPEVRL